MTKDELIKVVDRNTNHIVQFNYIVAAVEAYSAALIAAKPNVSGSLLKCDCCGSKKVEVWEICKNCGVQSEQ